MSNMRACFCPSGMQALRKSQPVFCFGAESQAPPAAIAAMTSTSDFGRRGKKAYQTSVSIYTNGQNRREGYDFSLFVMFLLNRLTGRKCSNWESHAEN